MESPILKNQDRFFSKLLGVHFVGESEQRGRQADAKLPRRFLVFTTSSEFSWRLNRQFRWWRSTAQAQIDVRMPRRRYTCSIFTPYDRRPRLGKRRETDRRPGSPHCATSAASLNAPGIRDPHRQEDEPAVRRVLERANKTVSMSACRRPAFRSMRSLRYSGDVVNRLAKHRGIGLPGSRTYTIPMRTTFGAASFNSETHLPPGTARTA